MCHRPAASRLTVTVDGSAPSGSGRDQRMSSGTAIFASVTWPFLYRNPDVVNAAGAFDRFRDFNDGYFARFPQKFTYACWRCCRPCCKATLDTSYSHAVPGSAFHAVSIRHVPANVTRRCSRVHARDRSASARLYTYRTDPHVRFSRPVCCGAG